MSNQIRCPECKSTNVQCAEEPFHQHECFDCGHTLVPVEDAEREPAGDLVEVFRKALMREHHHDWDMETISEAAHICARQLEQVGEVDWWEFTPIGWGAK